MANLTNEELRNQSKYYELNIKKEGGVVKLRGKISLGSLHWHKADERRNGIHISDSCGVMDREIRFVQDFSEIA